MLQHEYLLENIGFDTAENEPRQVCCMIRGNSWLASPDLRSFLSMLAAPLAVVLAAQLAIEWRGHCMVGAQVSLLNSLFILLHCSLVCSNIYHNPIGSLWRVELVSGVFNP